jgi:hypothetical protein
MRIYSVLIHGAFQPHVRLEPSDFQTHGFYTTRWVLARSEAEATEKAFRSATRELNRWPDLRDGLVSVNMEAEEIGPGSVWPWLRGGGRGFAFYFDD